MQSENFQNLSKSQGSVSLAQTQGAFCSALKLNKFVGLTLLALSVTISGCSSNGQSLSSKRDLTQSTVSSATNGSTAVNSKSDNAQKLNNLATTGQESEVTCGEGCDDIDAVAHLDGYVEDGDDIDAQPAFIDTEDEDDDSDMVQGERLGVEHVPLNAISPKTLQAFVEVIDVIRHDYVRPVNDEVLFQQAISGMLEKLDKHAEYLTPEDYDHLRSFTDGEVAQVGLSVKYNPIGQSWVIDSVLSQSSAKEAGIKVGDKLLRVKNADLTADMTEQDIQQLLSGIAGSQVQITVSNSQNGARRNITLQRNLPADNEPTVTVKNGIAIIRLPVFQNGSKAQIINGLKKSGMPVTGVVLDVRNNPGGVLSSAIDIASLFIKDGSLIQVRSRTNHGQIIKTNGTPYLSDLPVVILQNRYSASAAEVLASSFKSNHRAKILGEQSFGKGTVQEVVPLKSGGGIKLTVAEYRSTKGEQIDGVGVKPDLILTHDGADWQQQAVNLLLSQDRPLGIKFDNDFEDGSILNDY